MAFELTLDLSANMSRSNSANVDHDSLLSTVISEAEEVHQEPSFDATDEELVPDQGSRSVTPRPTNTAIASRPDELCVLQNATVTAGLVSPQSSVIQFAITPTITVVCPTSEEQLVDSSTTASIRPVAIELVTVEAFETNTVQIEVPGGHDPDAMYALEELSPTTEEYQDQCCAPDDFQLEGEILAPGCVAPAPTPAPSIAPLAEVEGDPADDDPEADDEDEDIAEQVTQVVETDDMIGSMGAIEPIVVIQSVATTAASKRHHRKKRSVEGQNQEGGGTGVAAVTNEASVSRQNSEEVAGHNTVCPWEDE